MTPSLGGALSSGVDDAGIVLSETSRPGGVCLPAGYSRAGGLRARRPTAGGESSHERTIPPVVSPEPPQPAKPASDGQPDSLPVRRKSGTGANRRGLPPTEWQPAGGLRRAR